jgi:micrococcal nuclease
MKKNMTLTLLTCLLVTGLFTVNAQVEYFGKVVGIQDGDTFYVLDTITKRQVRVRFAHIDAPEKAQPYGEVSKRKLSSLCYGKIVRYIVYSYDRWERPIADVFVGDNWINLQMVETGLAWHFKRYSSDSTISNAEQSARNTKIGLWKDSNPIPPWEWRKGDR